MQLEQRVKELFDQTVMKTRLRIHHPINLDILMSRLTRAHVVGSKNSKSDRAACSTQGGWGWGAPSIRAGNETSPRERLNEVSSSKEAAADTTSIVLMLHKEAAVPPLHRPLLLPGHAVTILQSSQMLGWLQERQPSTI